MVWSFVWHQRYLPPVADGHRAARVFLGGYPVAAFVTDGINIDGASVLAFDEAFLTADTLVFATLVEYFAEIVGLVVVETSLEYALHSCRK